MDEFFPVVYRYSRAQAIADGVLVDATQVGREAGFRVAVALTEAAWNGCVAWREDDTLGGAAGQSEQGRLWDVLFIAAHAARVHRDSNRDRAPFVVLRVPRGGRRAELAQLTLHIGPGDEGEAVATIMLPGED